MTIHYGPIRAHMATMISKQLLMKSFNWMEHLHNISRVSLIASFHIYTTIPDNTKDGVCLLYKHSLHRKQTCLFTKLPNSVAEW